MITRFCSMLEAGSIEGINLYLGYFAVAILCKRICAEKPSKKSS